MNRAPAAFKPEERVEDDFLDEQIAWRSARNPRYPEILRATLRRREERRRRPGAGHAGGSAGSLDR